jgi:uncharacterized protein (TIGR01777 family)
MRIVVTGGTGFIGRALCRALRGAGHAVTNVGRRAAYVPVPTVTWDQVGEAVRDADGIVNLAGESVAAGRWTPARRRTILDSRVVATRALATACAGIEKRPRVLVSASAVGYYGAHGDEPLDESAGPGTDFLADVCRAWEAEALRAEPLGLRVVRLRIGVVLAPDGGALGRMLLPFRAGLGGPLGSGRQVMSWIHRDDLVAMIVAALGAESWQGAVNATAPNPVTNREFAQTLGRVLSRPAVLPTPGFVLRLALGEMADMLLSGQRALPRAAQAQGFSWQHPALSGALAACGGG